MPPLLFTDETPQERDRVANGWTRSGIAFLQENTEASLRESILCFDQAITLRSSLPLEENVWFRYGLTAGWLNKGDALTRLGSTDQLLQAVHCYNEALSHLLFLPVEEHLLFRKRRIIAWTNRGITFQKLGLKEMLPEAIRSFEEALAILTSPATPKDKEFQCLQAGVWMNLAHVLLQSGGDRFHEARAAATEAISGVANRESISLPEAEVGLKARHALCQTNAHLLSEGEADPSLILELVSEATDAVEESIELAKTWEGRDIHDFRPLLHELFRFGARIYQSYQPHFLVEFLLEGLEDSASLRASSDVYTDSMNLLWKEIRALQEKGFQSINTPHFEQVLERFREVRLAESRLRVLAT